MPVTPIRPDPAMFEQRGYQQREDGLFVCPHCSALVVNWAEHESWHITSEDADA